jgi:hypothetical protein
MQPSAIVKTFPVHFFRDISPREFVRGFVIALNDPEHETVWWSMMGNRPKQEVQYCYIVIGNRVRYRASVGWFEGPYDYPNELPGFKTFGDGRTLYSRYWMALTGPVIKAPERIPMRGFQGFRYCDILF